MCPNLVCERHALRCKTSRGALSQAQPLSVPKVPNLTIPTRPSRVARRVFRARSPQEFLAHVSLALARASRRRVARQSFGTDREPSDVTRL